MPSLPDVLHLIPPYIRDIEDYLALSVTGREVRSLVQEYSSPSTLLVLCYHSRRTFFRPDPLFLLTPLAPPLSIWARRSTENLRRLVHAFYYGEEAVLDLGISVPAVAIEAKWSMARVCQLWEWRMRVVTPLTDLIDRCVGQQWYAQADFWDGGVEDAATLYAEPAEVVFRMLIYGELFKDGWHEWIEGTDRSQPVPPFAALSTRLEYVKYLLPDWRSYPTAHDGTPGIRRGMDITCDRPYHPGEIVTLPQRLTHPITGHVRTIHPFRAIQDGSTPYRDAMREYEHQTVLRHLLGASTLWGQVTTAVRNMCGGDFDTPVHKLRAVGGDVDWKQGLWENALYLLGYEGMEMVIQVWNGMRGSVGENGENGEYGGVDQRGPGWDKMRRYRSLIAAMTEEPEKVQIGKKWTYEIPHLYNDLGVAMWDN